MLQSPNMQTRVELFDLNENVAKQLHLHLDPCKVTQPSYQLYSTYYYSIQISDPNKRDAKSKAVDRMGISNF